MIKTGDARGSTFATALRENAEINKSLLGLSIFATSINFEKVDSFEFSKLDQTEKSALDVLHRFNRCTVYWHEREKEKS